MPVVRLQHVTLLAKDPEWASHALCQALDLEVVYRDPGVMRTDLVNALMPCGDSMLEVVAPTHQATEKSTPCARLLEKRGNCGFMVVLQVNDVVNVAHRLQNLGAQVLKTHGLRSARSVASDGNMDLWRYKLGEMRADQPEPEGLAGVQWHPKEMGTLVETNQAALHGGGVRVPGAWLPAGNRCKDHPPKTSSVCREIAGCDIACMHPLAMAKTWARGLQKPLTVDGLGVELDGATVRFQQALCSSRQGLIGVQLFAAEGENMDTTNLRERVLFELCGVRFSLVSRGFFRQGRLQKPGGGTGDYVSAVVLENEADATQVLAKL